MAGSRRIRTAALGALLLLVGLYGAVVLYFRVYEDQLVYYPERGALTPPPAELHLDSRDITLQAADGLKLVARVIPPPAEVPPASAGWLLYLHGNGGNIGYPGYNRAWAKFRRLGLGVLAIEYRGYGASEGAPSEAGLYRDADAAYAYLTKELHVPPARVLIYGYSLGGAVAIDLAARVPAAGLMVEGAFVSIPVLGSELYPFLPVALLARNRFASGDKIAAVAMPKLFIHARADEVVPLSHGQRLYTLAREPKALQEVAGGHITAHDVDPGFFTAVERFVGQRGLPLAATSSATSSSDPRP